jgi:hypothetical protein
MTKKQVGELSDAPAAVAYLAAVTTEIAGQISNVDIPQIIIDSTFIDDIVAKDVHFEDAKSDTSEESCKKSFLSPTKGSRYYFQIPENYPEKSQNFYKKSLKILKKKILIIIFFFNSQKKI